MPNASSRLTPVLEAQKSPGVSSYPVYDRQTLKSGIAHMSVGGFHRSHQALYLHNYLQTNSENWMIYGIGCLDSDIDLVTTMNAQQNLYTLTERSSTTDTLKVIGSLKEFVHAPSNPIAVIETLASDDIKIISLTITEKGYCYDVNGDLDLTHPLVQRDLSENVPKTAIGYLFEAAAMRMRNSGQPFTVMSCDNLLGNGRIARRVLLQFADKKDGAVADWIRDNVSFPNSMVDRITPVPTEATRQLVAEEFGIDDPAAIASEDFIQWILEDDFINGRPALESVGVKFVKSVEPYEQLKVRMLNGSHSALSYLSYLMGYRDVDVAMGDPIIHDFVKRYMDDDITPTIPEVPGVDVGKYKEILIERFSNPAIRDQIQRLAMDGSQKIPNAIVPPIQIQDQKHGSMRWIAFAVAAWYRYLQGVDENGAPIEITDPMAAELKAIASAKPTQIDSFLNVEPIFGSDVAASNVFVTAAQHALESIESMGTRDALTKLLQS